MNSLDNQITAVKKQIHQKNEDLTVYQSYKMFLDGLAEFAGKKKTKGNFVSQVASSRDFEGDYDSGEDSQDKSNINFFLTSTKQSPPTTKDEEHKIYFDKAELK